MMDSNGIQPVMPISGTGDFGSSGFMWILMLFFLLAFGGGGFGWGGYGNNALGNYATDSAMQRGFDEQNNIANQREILQAVNNGTAQTVATTNQVYHDVVNALSDKYSELQRDVAGIAVGQANSLANQNACCSAQKELILTTSADLGNKIAQDKYDTSMQMAQMEARLTAKMDANEIQNLRDQIQQLQITNATSGVLKYPQAWTFNGGYFPPFGCGCQNI